MFRLLQKPQVELLNWISLRGKSIAFRSRKDRGVKRKNTAAVSEPRPRSRAIGAILPILLFSFISTDLYSKFRRETKPIPMELVEKVDVISSVKIVNTYRRSWNQVTYFSLKSSEKVFHYQKDWPRYNQMHLNLKEGAEVFLRYDPSDIDEESILPWSLIVDGYLVLSLEEAHSRHVWHGYNALYGSLAFAAIVLLFIWMGFAPIKEQGKRE